MNIILTGMRGTGKTTLGQQIAQALKWNWLDVDHEFERTNKTTVHEFVKEKGWDAFRQKEKEIALKAALQNHTVISTGGGTLMDPQSAKALKNSGIIILLVCDLDILKNYLRSDTQRPSLTGIDPLEELEQVWNARKDRYHALADLIHDTSKWPSHQLLLDKLREHPKLKS